MCLLYIGTALMSPFAVPYLEKREGTPQQPRPKESWQTRQLDLAAAEFTEAARIFAHRDELNTETGANLYNNLAAVCGKQGRVDEAVAAYNSALKIRRATGTLNTALGALLLANYGVALIKKHERYASAKVAGMEKDLRTALEEGRAALDEAQSINKGLPNT